MSRRTTAVVVAPLMTLGFVAAPASTSAAIRGAARPAVVTRSAPRGLLVTRLKGVHNATQVISVTTAHYGSVHATVQAF